MQQITIKILEGMGMKLGYLRFEVSGIGANSVIKEIRDICLKHDICITIISDGLIFKSYTVCLKGDNVVLSALKTAIGKFW